MKIHFIGICGVAMGALAIAFKNNGHEVAGSDAGFFPPISDNLKKNRINFYPGWHVEKMVKNGNPDLTIVGNVASSTNPEWEYIQKNKLDYLSYPEAVAKYFVKENSIVCAGTYGKTTTAALLSWILTETGYNPNYMFGGLAIDYKFASAYISKSEYSVLEGDEYKSARWDNRPKFFHYSPTHLLLTAVKWDHADIYPTKESYFDAFRNLAGSIPKNGLAVLSENIPSVIVKLLNCPIIKYGQSKINDYYYYEVKQSIDGQNFKINHKSKIFNLQSETIGDYMAENITAVFAMACEIGVEPKKIIEAIKSFNGLKRRLEKRGVVNGADVYDDIAHSPAKAGYSLKTLRNIYIDREIFAIFEPNTGNRKKQSANGYKNAFKDATEVIIPRLTKIKIDRNDLDKPIDGEELANIISQTHDTVKYIDNNEKLINYLKEKTQPGDVIVFLGSHGFRGIIEQLVSR